MSRLLLLLLLVCLLACAPADREGTDSAARAAARGAGDTATGVRLTTQDAGTDALLQAVSAVDARTAWVSGHRGTVLRTTDGGVTWQQLVVPDADSLEFRDVHGASADEAWLLSAGPGARSRVYHTTDGGVTWRLVAQNPDAAGFWDCLDFGTARRGLLYGDAVDGRLVVLRTEDGVHWARVPTDALPAAQPDEGGFAASGTCVLAAGDGRAWIGTGNAARARVLRSPDDGRTWQAADVPILAGEGAGIATLARDDDGTLYALGGDVGNREAPPAAVFVSSDDGRSWRAAGATPLAGAVYGSAAVPGRPGTLVAVNPRGLAVSRDGARTWTLASSESFWAVAFAPHGPGWAVGPRGRLVKLEVIE